MRIAEDLIKADIVIIGAGVAGLSTAYHLATSSKKKILILEWEKSLGGHASGRNAGMIRQTVADPAIARLAVAGRRELARASRKGWKFDFLPNGSLLLAGKKQAAEIKKIHKNMENLGIPSKFLSSAEAVRKVPILEGGDFEKALFCPSDGLLENRPLLESFYARLKELNVSVVFQAAPKKFFKEGGYFFIDLGKKRIRTKKIVNAAGAWCAGLAREIGAQKIPLRPYRRHLYATRPLAMKHASWPFVWDLGQNFYFRPEGKGLLLSACDKAPVNKPSLEGRIEKIDARVKKILLNKMKKYSLAMSRLRIETQKSGLRTMVPDGRFVIGEDAKLASFYWVAGLGGHGVTTCFSVGKLSSDIILGRPVDAGLARAFSPRRFKA